jgi:hypothetical protein
MLDVVRKKPPCFVSSSVSCFRTSKKPGENRSRSHPEKPDGGLCPALFVPWAVRMGNGPRSSQLVRPMGSSPPPANSLGPVESAAALESAVRSVRTGMGIGT